MVSDRCGAPNALGARCGMHPIRGESYCIAHHPDRREQAQAARRLGGIRRRRERAMVRSYDITGLCHLDLRAIRRVAEIAILEALELENSIPRVRALLGGCSVLIKLREMTELEERLQAVELALRRDQ